jgi:hypothetical protein
MPWSGSGAAATMVRVRRVVRARACIIASGCWLRAVCGLEMRSKGALAQSVGMREESGASSARRNVRQSSRWVLCIESSKVER